MEKDLGYFSKFKSSTKEEQNEIRQRKIEMGKRIHAQNTQENVNKFIKDNEDEEERIYMSMLEKGLSPEVANILIQENRNVKESRNS